MKTTASSPLVPSPPIGSREWQRRELETQARAADDAREDLLAANRAAREYLANSNVSPRGADALRAEMAVRAGRADAFALTARRLRDEANSIPKSLRAGEGLIA